MNVPPAETYRSRIANDVSSPVRLPISMAPRLKTLTGLWVAGSLPIVRYFMTTSLVHRVLSRSSRRAEEVRHRTPDPRRIQPVQRRVVGRRPVPPQLGPVHAQAEQPVRPPRQGRRNSKRR